MKNLLYSEIMKTDLENISDLFVGEQDLVLNLKGNTIDLAIMSHGEITDRIVLPFGSQTILDIEKKGGSSYIYINDHLTALPPEYRQKVSDNKWLFVVGNVTHQLLKAHKKHQSYKEKIPKTGYKINIEIFNKLADNIASKSNSDLMDMFNISKRTVEHASAVATILNQIAYQFNVTAIVALNQSLRRDILDKMKTLPESELLTSDKNFSILSH